MRIFAKNISGIVILLALCLTANHVAAEDRPQGGGKAAAREVSVKAVPDISKIIPSSTELSVRLAALENSLTSMTDVTVFGKRFAGIEADLKAVSSQLQGLKDAKEHRYVRLADLKREIGRDNESFEEISEPLIKSIRQLASWRKEWLAEKERWKRWESSLRDEGQLPRIKSTFAKANDTIGKALELIRLKLEERLAAQEKVGTIQVKMKSLSAAIDGLILMRNKRFVIDLSPPMLSSRFFSQFGKELWYEARNGIDEISWPGRSFFDRYGWIVLLQGFLSLVVIIAVYRNRRLLLTSKRWGFLASRPFAAGIFSGFMSTLLLYEYQGSPVAWKLANSIVAGISFIRLTGNLVEESWKRQFVYVVATVFVVNRLIYLVSLPLPLVRIYCIVVAMAGIFLCLRWALESARHGASRLYARSLRIGCLYLAVIIIAQLWGKTRLALYLFASLMSSLAMILVFMLFMYMIHGIVEWLFRASPLQRGTAFKIADTDIIIRQAQRFIDGAIWLLLLVPAFLRIWGAFDSLEAATNSLLAFGVKVGTQRITVGLVILAAGVLYGSFLLSRILQRVLVDKVLVSRQAERGVRLAIERLVHYAVIFAGFLLTLSILGVEITKLTIMLSALGVGIGFGLQGVVNNFVSGLILLFERPLRVGDYIEFDGNWAEVRSIGLRATTVQTFDSSDVIIPNADLISNRVTNWTLNNRRRRLDIPVGVAYGSDVPLVIETLIACAKATPLLAETPQPQVLFLSFGESSLDFELRVFVTDVRNSMDVISSLHQEIDRRFREANIEIAFPQRDLHLRSIDDPVTVKAPEEPGTFGKPAKVQRGSQL